MNSSAMRPGYTLSRLLRCVVRSQPTTMLECSATITPGLAMMCQIRHKTVSKPRYKAPNVPKEKGRRMSQRKLLGPFENTDDPSDESFWMSEPVDDVWIRANYPTQQYGIEEAITRHQQYAQPAMHNCLDNILFVDMSINIATAKKTKFVRGVKETILLPHRFTYRDNNKCIVFCEGEDEMKTAMDHGALYAGSDRLIRMLDDDTLTKEDYDFILATPDIMTKLVPLRSKIRDLYPSDKSGTMGLDIAGMVTHFTYGITVESKVTTSEAINRLQAPIGPLEMKTEELAANLRHYIATLGESRPPKAVGDMIAQSFLTAPPSKELFFLSQSAVAYKRTKVKRDKAREEEEDIEEAEEVS